MNQLFIVHDSTTKIKQETEILKFSVEMNKTQFIPFSLCSGHCIIQYHNIVNYGIMTKTIKTILRKVRQQIYFYGFQLNS